MTKPHPNQAMEIDSEGVVRWRGNPIIRALLGASTASGIGLNELARMEIGTAEDWAQFAQLLGYSVSGWGSLSYVGNRAANAADVEAAKLLKETPLVDTDHQKP